MFGIFNKKSKLDVLESYANRITYVYELDNPVILLKGDPTIVQKTQDSFNLYPPRKVEKHYGNTQYLDRVLLPINTSENELNDIIKSMYDSFTSKHGYNRKFKATFRIPGSNLHFRESEVSDHVELRFYVGLDT